MPIILSAVESLISDETFVFLTLASSEFTISSFANQYPFLSIVLPVILEMYQDRLNYSL
jgi:hypothetical protein